MAVKSKSGRRAVLSALQERFCREYVVDLNATAAAKRAGYSNADAPKQGCVLLKKAYIRELVEKLKSKQFKKIELKAENVLLELARIGFVDPVGMFDGNGCMLSIHEIPEDIRRAIASVEVQTVYAGTGVARTEVGRAIKIKFWSKVEALETIGKHFRLWIERLEISGRVELAEALKKARERRVQRAVVAGVISPPAAPALPATEEADE